MNKKTIIITITSMICIAIIITSIIIINKNNSMNKEEMISLGKNIDLNKIGEDIKNNIVTAREKYKNQIVMTEGIVEEINYNGIVLSAFSRIQDEYVVDRYNLDIKPTKVIANIDKEDINKISNGQIITIVGKIDDVSNDKRYNNCITMKKAYVYKDTTIVKGDVSIPTTHFLYKNTIYKSEWSCKIAGYDVTDFATEKNFDNEGDSIIKDIPVYDGKVVEMEAKVIDNKVVEILNIK